MLRNKRTDNAKQPPPETRHATRGTTHGRRKGLARPAVQHRVEHALAEVFHGAETDVGCGTVYGAEDKDRNAHKGGGENHGEFAADMKCLVEK